MFGHVKGSFTGATADKKGIFEVCKGGTVHLDEINRMDQRHLPKILRALQEREIRRVGGSDTLKIDVLFIATTNEDLTQGVNEGTFPRDLYDRLSGTTLKIPALRDRLEDVPLLVNRFLEKGYPDSPTDRYRFPFALWCIDRAQSDPKFSIRGLQNTIRDCVTRSLAPRLDKPESPEKAALRKAILAIKGEGGKLSKAKVARRVEWKGKTGVDDSLLSREWKTWWDELV